jgi:phenylacetate-CoA ligase
VAVRRLAGDDPQVHRALFGDDPRLPMLFQYNPVQHHVTVNGDGELLFTINRLDVLAPRIAYNVHDQGGVASLDELASRLASCGYDVGGLADDIVPLPFLWVYGRTDSTVSVMGANIYPEDLERALYEVPDLARITTSFCLGSEAQADGTIRPLFAFAITAEPDDELTERFAAEITERVRDFNADFRAAAREHPAAVAPVIRLHRPGEGPFAADGAKIKQTRMLSGRRKP